MAFGSASRDSNSSPHGQSHSWVLSTVRAKDFESLIYLFSKST